MKNRNSNISGKKHIVHPFEPIINADSKVLILGSLPSVKSREQCFYYGHPQNRFWKIVSSILGEECPLTIDEKRALLVKNHIAVYDAIYECDIIGSADSTIENVIPTDIAKLIEGTDVGIVYCNGSTSFKYCMKYNKDLRVPVVCLPSTSPANAAWSLEALGCAWSRVARYLRRFDKNDDTYNINDTNNADNRNWYSLNEYVRDTYSMKLYKTPIDGGFTCPNRDGTKGIGGCIFCDNEGSGHFTGKAKEGVTPISEQINRGKSLVASKLPKNGAYGYIAYFQAYTSTYAPVERLRELFEEAIADPEVKVLSIATRPDCLGKDVIELIHELTLRLPVWIELGLQTSKCDSYVQINRCYDNKVYLKAINDLRKAGVKQIITHIILGLPGESDEDMLASVRYACDAGTDGIKLQLLHILKGTVLADMYDRGEFETLSMEHYAELVCKAVKIIPPDVVIHRITGDGDKNKLIAPMWSADKKRVLNYLNSQLAQL